MHGLWLFREMEQTVFLKLLFYHVKTTIMVVSAPIYGVKYFVIINLTNFFKRVKVG